eukprot:GHVN01035055.1.p1 GENE.GHVN01035055.1~~GHVN01035055.1.p1  ORF type:complete len:199 (+),score=5.77 GHVN01035055.1:1975-2571(+)
MWRDVHHGPQRSAFFMLRSRQFSTPYLPSLLTTISPRDAPPLMLFKTRISAHHGGNRFESLNCFVEASNQRMISLRIRNFVASPVVTHTSTTCTLPAKEQDFPLFNTATQGSVEVASADCSASLEEGLRAVLGGSAGAPLMSVYSNIAREEELIHPVRERSHEERVTCLVRRLKPNTVTITPMQPHLTDRPTERSTVL